MLTMRYATPWVALLFRFVIPNTIEGIENRGANEGGSRDPRSNPKSWNNTIVTAPQ